MDTYIRTANERDIPAIQKLLRTTWHATYDAIYGVDRVDAITKDWHSLTNLKASLDRPYSEFIVAEGSAGIVGMASASQFDPSYAMLHQLYVLPQTQGQGIGGDLLQEITEAFPDAKAIRLEVETANTKAVGFYEAAGFAAIDETKNCGNPASGIAAIVMERKSR